MGGGESKPFEPTVIEDPLPTRGPRLDGVSRALANACDGCRLQVVSGVSSSSVKLSRTYGSVSYFQCGTYAADKKRVEKKEMSLQDFVGRLQSGKYYRNLNNGYCEQVELSREDALNVKDIGEVDGKVRTVRIQKVSSGGFSADTKVIFTPSIPFQMKFSVKNDTSDIPVANMTLYHPCPLRLDGVQPDAVLSLNDPSIEGSGFVILIPLIGRNDTSSSIGFLQKIMSQVTIVSQPNPSTGDYLSQNIPTGANWTLSSLFETQAGEGSTLEVLNGFYSWKGMPAFERVQEDTFFDLPGAGRVKTGVRYKWVPTGKPSPTYIMLDTPVACNPADLATLTSRIPMTPPEDAIHQVLYSTNPLHRGIVHKQGPPVSPEECSRRGMYREMFTDADLNAITEESCDPWQTWAQTANRGYTTDMIFTLMFNVTLVIAAAVGAYLAIVAVVKMYDVQVRGVAEGVGKIAAVFAKDLQQKATNMKNAVSNVTNIAKNPLAFAKGQAQTGLNNVASNAQTLS